MHKLFLLVLTLFFTGPNVFAANSRPLVCSIGQGYAVKVYFSDKTVELWEIAGGVGTPIVFDNILQQKHSTEALPPAAKEKITLNLEKEGFIVLFVPKRDGEWLEGKWNHNGRLDSSLEDEDEFNENHIATLLECNYSDLVQ